MRKIALITPMLQPYRITFYEKLNRFSKDVEWRVYHGIKKAEDGRPAYSGSTSFTNVGCVESNYRIGPYTLVTHWGLLREIIRFNPDMIIIQSIAGNLSYQRVVNWAKRNDKYVLSWACAWEPGRSKGLLLKFKNFFVSSFYQKSHAVMTYSTKAVDYVKKMGVDESNITVCYNGIEIDDLLINEAKILEASAKIHSDLKLGDATVFLYVGGLLPEKRVDLLIDAFENIRGDGGDLRLIIIGDGPMRKAITEKLNALNDNRITYLGRIINGVDSYFASSTCLVLPGIGGLALNQAMFWRKICICSEADGTEDDLVIDGKTGFRFNSGDLNGLTGAMQKVISLSKVEKESMGNSARNIIETKSNVNHMLKVFTDTIIQYFPEIQKNG